MSRGEENLPRESKRHVRKSQNVIFGKNNAGSYKKNIEPGSRGARKREGCSEEKGENISSSPELVGGPPSTSHGCNSI